jgi:hypothetical protein
VLGSLMMRLHNVLTNCHAYPSNKAPCILTTFPNGIDNAGHDEGFLSFRNCLFVLFLVDLTEDTKASVSDLEEENVDLRQSRT